MKKHKLLTLLLLLLFGFFSYGQNDSINTKYLSIGSKSSGICFGNSMKYNGLRLNLWDKGLISAKFENRKINGINLTFAAVTETTNGFQIGGIVSHSDIINGVSISSIWHRSTKINGFAASFGIASDTLNGVFVGFLTGSKNPNIKKSITNGIVISVFNKSEKINGVAFSLIVNQSIKQKGFSVSVFNKTEELHGLQIGLLNYVGNNPRLLRWLPLINFHP